VHEHPKDKYLVNPPQKKFQVKSKQVNTLGKGIYWTLFT